MDNIRHHPSSIPDQRKSRSRRRSLSLPPFLCPSPASCHVVPNVRELTAASHVEEFSRRHRRCRPDVCFLEHIASMPRRITEHTEPIVALAFSPNSRLFASASKGSNIILWDVQTWSKLHRLMPSGPTRSLAFVAGGFLFAETACEGDLDSGGMRCRDILSAPSLPRRCTRCIVFRSLLLSVYQKRGLKSGDIHRSCAHCAQPVGSRTHVLQATV